MPKQAAAFALALATLAGVGDAFAQSIPPGANPGAIMRQEMDRRTHPEFYDMDALRNRRKPKAGKQDKLDIQVDRSRVQGQIVPSSDAGASGAPQPEAYKPAAPSAEADYPPANRDAAPASAR